MLSTTTLKQKSFQETQISSSKCIEHQVFVFPQLKLLMEFWVSLSYAILNFKIIVCPKNVWMRDFALLVFPRNPLQGSYKNQQLSILWGGLSNLLFKIE